jgi:hypothetical protein
VARPGWFTTGGTGFGGWVVGLDGGGGLVVDGTVVGGPGFGFVVVVVGLGLVVGVVLGAVVEVVVVVVGVVVVVVGAGDRPATGW